jgi:hypothetical protein
MTREQAINYLFSCGFTNEQVCEVVRALTYDSTPKNDLGVDCISRADAIKAMQDKAKKLTNEDTINGLCGAVAMLYEMPSVTPQLRKGHWIVAKGSYLGMRNACCSNCKDFYTNDWNVMNYCPNCGADMREVEE